MKIHAAVLTAVLAAAGARAQNACDRACLADMVTQYLNALAAHNPGALPLAPNARFTEDTVERKLGEGLWEKASKIRPYRLDILDVPESTAASFVIVEEAGSPALVVLRLKVVGRKLTEIETMVVRSQAEGRLFNLANLETVSPAMTAPVPAGQRLSREEALRVAMFYPAGLKVGSFVSVDAPFAADAYRLENGAPMAGGACTREGCQNIKTQRIIEHPAITTKVKAIDEEAGIVLLRMNFGDTNSYGPGNALIVWEAFKVFGGQIHAVEAFMEVMPASAGSGWD
jgi:hypothetical protein